MSFHNRAATAISDAFPFSSPALAAPAANNDMAPELAYMQVEAHVPFLVDALDHLPAGLAVYDHELRLVYCNKILRQLLGYPPELFAEGAPTMEQIFRFNAERGEYGEGDVEEFVASKMSLARLREAHTYERRRPNGAVLEVRGVPLQNGGFATIYIDVSAQKVVSHAPTQAELGIVNKLTGLPTLKAVERNITNCQRHLKASQKACIMTIEIARFNELSERHGRVVSDFALREIAIRLSAAIRGSDFLGHTATSRFMIVHPVILRPSDPAKLARRLINEVKRPIACGTQVLELSATVGFTLIDSEDRDLAGVMLRCNDSLSRDDVARQAGDWQHHWERRDQHLSDLQGVTSPGL
jgi:diguanylate cyclase (GGDEF)-like protein